jgi:microcystin-dependent protein
MTLAQGVRYHIISDASSGARLADISSIARDGSTAPLANLPMGGYQHTGVAAATGSGQYAEYNQMLAAATAAATAAAAAVAVPPGTIIKSRATSVPSGWLYCNGQAVLRASYSALDSAIYCGDGNNATAVDSYRATSNSNPSSNRSTSGNYLVLPDMRGYFPRGFDDGAGVDSGRNLYASQADQFQDHTHGLPGTNYERSGGGSLQFTDVNDYSIQSGSAGTGNHGSETRPKNIAMKFYIKT